MWGIVSRETLIPTCRKIALSDRFQASAEHWAVASGVVRDPSPAKPFAKRMKPILGTSNCRAYSNPICTSMNVSTFVLISVTCSHFMLIAWVGLRQPLRMTAPRGAIVASSDRTSIVMPQRSFLSHASETAQGFEPAFVLEPGEGNGVPSRVLHAGKRYSCVEPKLCAVSDGFEKALKT